MYYGEPRYESDEVYDQFDGTYLIESYESYSLCTAIAELFGEVNWLDILRDHQIQLETVFKAGIDKQEAIVVKALLLYLVESLILEDKYIDALNNGFLVKLLKRLKILTKTKEKY